MKHLERFGFGLGALIAIGLLIFFTLALIYLLYNHPILGIPLCVIVLSYFLGFCYDRAGT